MKFKKITASALAAVFMFSATACGSVKTSADDTAAVKAAFDKFSACSSYTTVQTTDREETVTIEKESQDYSGSTVVETGFILSPVPQLYTRTTATMHYDDQTMEHGTVSYIIPENGGYTEYFSDNVDWYKFSVDDSHALDGLTTAEVTSTFYADKLEYGKVGEETLEGGKAIRYDAPLGGEMLVNMLESYGHLASIAEMSENQQAKIKANLAKDLDTVTVSVWVDAESGYPVRFEVKLTQILKDFEKSVAKSLGSTPESSWVISKYDVSMTVKDFNAVEEFVLPVAAESAAVYEA